MSALRLSGWLMMASLVAAATFTAAAGTAHACSCIARELSEYADDITVAFVGTQLERAVHDYVEDNGAVLLFSVDRVYVGEAGPLIEVRTHAQGSACGIDLDGRGPVGVAAHMWRGDLSVGLCGSVVAVDALEEVFGEGRPPDESIRLPVSPDPSEDFFNTGLSPDETQLAAPRASGSDRDQSLLAILVVAGAAAVVVTGAVVWCRRR